MRTYTRAPLSARHRAQSRFLGERRPLTVPLRPPKMPSREILRGRCRRRTWRCRDALTRLSTEAIARARLRALRRSAEYVVTTGQIPGAGGVYRGPEGYRRFLESWWDEFDEPGIEVHELIEAGDQVAGLADAPGPWQAKRRGDQLGHLADLDGAGRQGRARAGDSRAGKRPSKPPGFRSRRCRRRTWSCSTG